MTEQEVTKRTINALLKVIETHSDVYGKVQAATVLLEWVKRP